MTYEEYLSRRAALAEENAYLVGNVLSERERQVDAVLQRLKAELRAAVPEDRLFKMNTLSYEPFWSSGLYRFVRRLPKGSDLHVHATALLPNWKLIDFVAGRPELVVDPETARIHHRAEDIPELRRCRPLGELMAEGVLTREALEERWTLRGRAHNENVWEYFESILLVCEGLEFDVNVLEAYYELALTEYVNNHIDHIEIHALLSEDLDRAEELARCIRRAYHTVRRQHPSLLVSVICAGLKYRGVAPEVPRTYLNNALRLRERVQDDFDPADPHPFIIGFDLLNEEDKSIPLKDFAPMLLQLREEHPDFNLYLHCGESLNAQSDNLIDAYLLGAARVGHGMNLYRYPKLLARYTEREICLEACLISNQTLKYTRDLRLHPGAEYLKRGVTISLCSDDPSCQEHESLVDDFFAAILCWDLSIADVKQLAINSVLYSGLDPQYRSALIRSFRADWAAFIEEQTNT